MKVINDTVIILIITMIILVSVNVILNFPTVSFL